MRLRDISDILATFEGGDLKGMWGAVRAPGFKAFLTGQPGRGPTGPGTYHPRELIRARLLMAARRAGLDLVELNDGLNRPAALHGERPASALIPGGGILNLSGLDSIIRGAVAGETWLIRARISVTGRRDQQTSIVYASDPTRYCEDLTATALADLVSGRNPTVRATMFLNASELVAPILPVYQQLMKMESP